MQLSIISNNLKNFIIKKKKKTISLTAILVISGLFLALNSCKKDGSGLDNTAKMFVGTWIRSDCNLCVWEFKSDGNCSYIYDNGLPKSGTWKYLSEKKILVTDISDWTWEILDITDTQWVGEGGSGKRYVYTRKK